MYLLVDKRGYKYWRLDYRFQGKCKTLTLGIFPEVSFKDARGKTLKSLSPAGKWSEPQRSAQGGKATHAGKSF